MVERTSAFQLTRRQRINQPGNGGEHQTHHQQFSPKQAADLSINLTLRSGPAVSLSFSPLSMEAPLSPLSSRAICGSTDSSWKCFLTPTLNQAEPDKPHPRWAQAHGQSQLPVPYHPRADESAPNAPWAP